MIALCQEVWILVVATFAGNPASGVGPDDAQFLAGTYGSWAAETVPAGCLTNLCTINRGNDEAAPRWYGQAFEIADTGTDGTAPFSGAASYVTPRSIGAIGTSAEVRLSCGRNSAGETQFVQFTTAASFTEFDWVEFGLVFYCDGSGNRRREIRYGYARDGVWRDGLYGLLYDENPRWYSVWHNHTNSDNAKRWYFSFDGYAGLYVAWPGSAPHADQLIYGDEINDDTGIEVDHHYYLITYKKTGHDSTSYTRTTYDAGVRNFPVGAHAPMGSELHACAGTTTTCH